MKKNGKTYYRVNFKHEDKWLHVTVLADSIEKAETHYSYYEDYSVRLASRSEVETTKARCGFIFELS